jgi:hypothetical protein
VAVFALGSVAPFTPLSLLPPNVGEATVLAGINAPYANSSSNALASFRSRASKPPVN